MALEHRHPASELVEHLYSALSLAERASCVRQAKNGSSASETDTTRAVATLERWKSQSPFSAGGFFERRLQQDNLTEKDLLAILALPPKVYAQLTTVPPDWLTEIEGLYLSPRSTDPGEADLEFSRHAAEETNGFLWLAHPLIQEGRRRLRKRMRPLAVHSLPFDPGTVEGLVLPHLFGALHSLLAMVMVLELNVARLQGLLKGDRSEDRFRNFCDRLRHKDVQLSIAREYPVLMRALYTRLSIGLIPV